MRFILFIILSLSSTVFAASATISVDNLKPTVIETDFTYFNPDGSKGVAYAPYFIAGYIIANTGNETLSFSTVDYVVNADNGMSTKDSLILEECIEVAPGGTYNLGRWMISDLPETGVNYLVGMKAVGWVGTCAEPISNFETPVITFTAFTEVL